MKEIPLTKGFVALIDDEDFALVSQFSWHAYKGKWAVYANAIVGGKLIGMHAFLMNPPPGMDVDHRDRNGLNNCRQNLRLATRSQNSANAIGHKRKRPDAPQWKGVTRRTGTEIFMARIVVNLRTIHLGNFRDAEEAARAYDAAARRHFGEFARTNFPAQQGDIPCRAVTDATSAEPSRSSETPSAVPSSSHAARAVLVS